MATRMTWDSFIAIPNGTRVFNHGGDQCVALANLYQESVLGQPFVAVGSAYQWWTLFRNYPALFNTYKQSGVPIAGAVVVSRYGIYDAPNGHIEVVTSVNSDGSFNTMGQNASGDRYVWRYRRTMQNILGFLHPYNNPANHTPPNPESKSEEDDIMAIYLRPTSNSSPLKPGDAGSSRIWAGDDRNIGGVIYSGTWERSDDGSVRRLFPDEWAAIQRAYASVGRKVPQSAISGNELEKMVYVKR